MVDPQAVTEYGAPATMWIRYTVRPSGDADSGLNTCYIQLVIINILLLVNCLLNLF